MLTQHIRPVPLPDGVITSVGSDSMGELMNVWVEHYKKLRPKVTVQLTSGGSAAAPAALIEGSANIGPMARPMKPSGGGRFPRTLWI